MWLVESKSQESGRPDSNRRRPAWEAGILPLNYARNSTVSIPHPDPRFKLVAVHAVSIPAAFCNPKRSIPNSRSLNFWTFPVTVVGYSSTKTTYRGIL
jgi:hypothetical protein